MKNLNNINDPSLESAGTYNPSNVRNTGQIHLNKDGSAGGGSSFAYKQDKEKDKKENKEKEEANLKAKSITEIIDENIYKNSLNQNGNFEKNFEMNQTLKYLMENKDND